jgi:hypothetical protein
MSSRRVMNGATDLTGSTNPQGQRITRMVTRRPLAWELRCTICGGSQSPVAHNRAEYAVCRNTNCGKSVTSPRATLATTVNKSVAVRSRDSESARQFHTEEEQRERQRAEADEKRQAAEQGQREEERQKARKKLIAESITADIDPLFAGIDPATLAGRISVPVNKVTEWNRDQVHLFKKSCPGYFPCPENFDALVGYLQRNAPGLRLISAKQWEAAYRRLASLGLLKERPVVTSESEPERERAQTVVLEVGPPSDPNSPDAVVDGWDLESGAPRKWTNRELDKLSSTDYRRALHLYSVDAARHLGLPGADRVLVAAGKELG